LQQVEATYVENDPDRYTAPLSRRPLIAEVRDETRSVPVVPVVGKVAVGKNLFQISRFASDRNIPPMLSLSHDTIKTQHLTMSLNKTLKESRIIRVYA
jgi:hypothetical protein